MKKKIGTILKELRKNARMTQKEAYTIIGVPQSTFSSWERNVAEPSAENLMKLCKLYKVKDIYSTFGYDGYNDDGTLSLNLYECELIENYRKLNGPIRNSISELVKVTASSMEPNVDEDVSEDIDLESKTTQSEPIYLAAASGSEGADNEELERIDNDIQRILSGEEDKRGK